MLGGASFSLDHEVDNIESDEVPDAPTKQLAFVSEPTLASLTNPQALNSGGLHDIYIKRKDDFEEPELLEVQYNDGRGGIMREIIFVDPVYAEKRPRICVSIEGVQAMHRAIGVLSRKVDNLVNTLRSCRHAYYHELQALRDQIYQVTYAKEHNKEAPKHAATYFDPTQFDTSISEEVLERKLAEATIELKDKLQVSKDEFQRLEKRLKLYEKDGAIDDPRSRIEKLVENVGLEKLMGMIKASMGRGNVDELFEVLERMLGEYKSERGTEVEEKSLQSELDDLKKYVTQLLQQENEHKARSAQQRAEIETLKKNLVEERKLLNKESTGASDKLGAIAEELDSLRDQLSKSEATITKNREEANERETKLQEQLTELTRQLGIKEEALKRHVVAKRIADAAAGKKIENYSPEELVSTLAVKMNKKELGAIAFDIAAMMEDEDKMKLGKKLVHAVQKDGPPQSMIDEYLAGAKEDNLHALIVRILPKLADKAKRSDIMNQLLKDTEEEEIKTFAGNLPEFARKSIVVDSLNALASTATSRESDSESASDDEPGKVGKVIFDPSNDLTKRARRALLQKLFKRLPATEVKQICASLGQKSREALYKCVFEDQNAEDLRRGISVIQEKDCLQAIAEGLNEDALEVLMSMIALRGGRDLTRLGSKEILIGEQASKSNRRGGGVSVQTEIAGVATVLAVDKDSRTLSGRERSPQPPKDMDIDERDSPRATDQSSPSPTGHTKKKRQSGFSSSPSRFGKRTTRKPTLNLANMEVSDDAGNEDQASPESHDAEKMHQREASVSSRDTGTEPHSPRSDRGRQSAANARSDYHRQSGRHSHIQTTTTAQATTQQAPSTHVGDDESPRRSGHSLKKTPRSGSDRPTPSLAVTPLGSRGADDEIASKPHQSAGSDRESLASRHSMVSIDDDWLANNLSPDAPRQSHNAEVQTAIRVENAFIVHDDHAVHERDVVLELSQLALYFLKTLEHTNVMRRAHMSIDHYAAAVDRTKELVSQQENLCQEILKMKEPEKLAAEIGVNVIALPEVAVSAAAEYTRAVYEYGETSPQAKTAALAFKQSAPLPEATPQEFAVASLQHQKAMERQASAQMQASHTYSQGIAVAQSETAAITYHQAVESHGVESEQAQVASHAYAHAVAMVHKEGAAAIYHQVVQQHGKDSKEAQIACQEYVHAMANAKAESAAVLYQEAVALHGAASEEAVIASEAYNQAALVVQAENAALAYTQALVKHGLESAEAHEASEQYAQVLDISRKAEETKALAEEALEASTAAADQFQKAIEENGGLSPAAIAASVDYVHTIAEEAGLHIDELTASVTQAHALRGEESKLPPQVLAAAAAFSQAMQEPELMSPLVKEASENFSSLLNKEGVPEKAREAAAIFAEAMEKQAQLPPQAVAVSASQVQSRHTLAGIPSPKVQQSPRSQLEPLLQQIPEAHDGRQMQHPPQMQRSEQMQEQQLSPQEESEPNQFAQEPQQQTEQTSEQSPQDAERMQQALQTQKQATPASEEQSVKMSLGHAISHMTAASNSESTAHPREEESSDRLPEVSVNDSAVATEGNQQDSPTQPRHPQQSVKREDSQTSTLSKRSLQDYSKALQSSLSVMSASPLEIKGRSTLKEQCLATMQQLSEHAQGLAEAAEKQKLSEDAIEPGKYIETLAERSGIPQEEVQAVLGDVLAGDPTAPAPDELSSTWNRKFRTAPPPLTMKDEESCPSCGESRLPDSNFCRKCGARLSKRHSGEVRRSPASAPDPHHSAFVAQRAFGKLRSGLRSVWNKKQTASFASSAALEQPTINKEKTIGVVTGGTSSHIGSVDWRKSLHSPMINTHTPKLPHSLHARPHPPLPAHLRQQSGPLQPNLHGPQSSKHLSSRHHNSQEQEQQGHRHGHGDGDGYKAEGHQHSSSRHNPNVAGIGASNAQHHVTSQNDSHEDRSHSPQQQKRQDTDDKKGTHGQSRDAQIQGRVESQPLASSSETPKLQRSSTSTLHAKEHRRASVDRRGSHISLDFMKIETPSRKGNEQSTPGVVNWKAELQALPSAVSGSLDLTKDSEDSSSNASSRVASRGRNGIQEDRRRSRDLSREARRRDHDEKIAATTDPYKYSTTARVMHATFNHKENAQLLDAIVAKTLQKQVEKQLKSEAFQDVRRALDEQMGPDERRDLESSVAAAAMQGFMAISEFLKQSDRELSPIGNKAKLLEDTKHIAMKTAVQNALKVYHAVGTDISTPDNSPHSKTPPHSYPPAARVGQAAKRGSIMTAPTGQRPSLFHGSPRKFVADLVRSGLVDSGLADIGQKFQEVRKLIPEQAPLEEEPPIRAANAAEWLNFFQGKRGKESAIISPLGFGRRPPSFAGIAGTGLVKAKLKPLRTPRGGHGHTPITADGIINSSRSLDNTVDNDVQRQLNRPVLPSPKVPPRLQEFDASGLNLNISSQPNQQKFARGVQALGATTVARSAKPEFIRKADSLTKASTLTSFEETTSITSLENSELPPAPEYSTVEPNAPLSSRSAKNIAASRVELAADDLFSGMETASSQATSMKERRKREVRKLPALSQITAEKVIAAGKSAQAGLEVKLMIDHKIENVVPHQRSSKRSCNSPEAKASSSRSSSLLSYGGDSDHDELELVGQTKHQEPRAPMLQLSNDYSAVQFSSRPEEVAEIREVQSEVQSARGRRLMGMGTSLASNEDRGSFTERSILPASHVTSISDASRQRVGLTKAGPLVSRVKEQLELHYGSLAAAWVGIESKNEGVLTLGAMQRAMVQAGINPEDAGHFLQAIIEQMSGMAGASIPGDRAPGRAEFLGALIPGKLPQKALDAAHRRSSMGSAWWSEGRISPNFRMAAVQDGVSFRDANTILSARTGL